MSGLTTDTNCLICKSETKKLGYYLLGTYLSYDMIIRGCNKCNIVFVHDIFVRDKMLGKFLQLDITIDGFNT